MKPLRINKKEILRCPDSIDSFEWELDSRFQERIRDVLFCCEPSRTLHSCILRATISHETVSNLSLPTATYLVRIAWKFFAEPGWHAISGEWLGLRMEDAMRSEWIGSYWKRRAVFVVLFLLTPLGQATYGEQPVPTGSGPATSAVTVPASTLADLIPSVIQLDRPVHFMSPEGGPLVIPTGTYRVNAIGATTMQLAPEDGSVFLIEALVMHHPDTVAEPVALSIPAKEDGHHVVLLLPKGQGLDAVGSYSEIRPRGWDPTPVLLELVEKALAQKEKPIRKEEKKGGH